MFISEFFLKILFIWEREHAGAEAEAEGEGEADSPLSREPNAGLDPRTLRSWPEPKSRVGQLQETTIVGEDVEKGDPSYIVGGMQVGTATLENSVELP